MVKYLSIRVADKWPFITRGIEEWHTVLTGLCAMEYSRTSWTLPDRLRPSQTILDPPKPSLTLPDHLGPS